MLPEVIGAEAGEIVPGLAKEYSSADDVLGPDETRRLLERHSLLLHQVRFRRLRTNWAFSGKKSPVMRGFLLIFINIWKYSLLKFATCPLICLKDQSILYGEK